MLTKAKCMRYKKDELIKMCSKKKLNTSGTKEDLCKRLTKSPAKKTKSPKKVKKSPKKRSPKKEKKVFSIAELTKAKSIYPDISPSTIEFARKRGIDIIEWAKRLKKTRKERDAYWAQR